MNLVTVRVQFMNFLNNDNLGRLPSFSPDYVTSTRQDTCRLTVVEVTNRSFFFSVITRRNKYLQDYEEPHKRTFLFITTKGQRDITLCFEYFFPDCPINGER